MSCSVVFLVYIPYYNTMQLVYTSWNQMYLYLVGVAYQVLYSLRTYNIHRLSICTNGLKGCDYEND
jgi:hypothetical protein